MKLVPIANKVLIKEFGRPEKIGDIFVPHSKSRRDRRSIGEIIAVGEEVTKFKAGDVVAVTLYAGQHLDFERQEYVSCIDTEILGLIEGDHNRVEVGETRDYMRTLE